MPEKTNEFPLEGEGVSPKKIKALDTAIDDWRSAVEKRMALVEKEIEAGAKVVELMHKHDVTAYPYYDGDDNRKICRLTSKEKLKLEKDKGESEVDAEDSDLD